MSREAEARQPIRPDGGVAHCRTGEARVRRRGLGPATARGAGACPVSVARKSRSGAGGAQRLSRCSSPPPDRSSVMAGRATRSQGPFDASRPRVSSALMRERRRRSMSISSGLRAPGRWHHRPWGSHHARRLLAGLAVSWLRRARVSVSPGPPPRPLASLVPL